MKIRNPSAHKLLMLDARMKIIASRFRLKYKRGKYRSEIVLIIADSSGRNCTFSLSEIEMMADVGQCSSTFNRKEIPRGTFYYRNVESELRKYEEMGMCNFTCCNAFHL